MHVTTLADQEIELRQSAIAPRLVDRDADRVASGTRIDGDEFGLHLLGGAARGPDDLL